MFGDVLQCWYQLRESDLKWKHAVYCENGDYFPFG